MTKREKLRVLKKLLKIYKQNLSDSKYGIDSSGEFCRGICLNLYYRLGCSISNIPELQKRQPKSIKYYPFWYPTDTRRGIQSRINVITKTINELS